MQDVRFGTDGWRGIIAKDFTFENLKRIAQATSIYILRKLNKPKIVIGYDTRFMSDSFAKLCAQVFAGNNIEVVISKEFCSTPCVSFQTRYNNFNLGIVITASHNPYYFNGFKIKKSTGGAASKSLTDEVVSFLDKKEPSFIDYDLAGKQGLIQEKDLKKEYIKFIKNYIDLKKLKKLRSFRILVDLMFGSAQGILEKVLEDTGVKIEFLRNELNPLYGRGRPEPVKENLKELIRRVKNSKFKIGLAFDGDGDRLASVLDNGEFLHPQIILPLLAIYLKESRSWRGVIVKTVVGSMLIDEVAKHLSSDVVETPVGFKYISEVFEREDVLVGGEEAGGIGVKNYIPERDGVMSACLLLEMVAAKGESLREIVNKIERRFGRFYYLRSDKHLGEDFKGLDNIKYPRELLGRKVRSINRKDGIKLITSQSWLMFRKSGTEPLVRIYAEAKSLKESRELIRLGERLIT